MGGRLPWPPPRARSPDPGHHGRGRPPRCCAPRRARPPWPRMARAVHAWPRPRAGCPGAWPRRRWTHHMRQCSRVLFSDRVPVQDAWTGQRRCAAAAETGARARGPSFSGEASLRAPGLDFPGQRLGRAGLGVLPRKTLCPPPVGCASRSAGPGHGGQGGGQRLRHGPRPLPGARYTDRHRRVLRGKTRRSPECVAMVARALVIVSAAWPAPCGHTPYHPARAVADLGFGPVPGDRRQTLSGAASARCPPASSAGSTRCDSGARYAGMRGCARRSRRR